MWMMLVAAALAAPSGWTVTKTDVDGCELSLGPAEADGVVPMRAECYWADVSLDKFKAKLADYGAHDDYFTVVAESTVQRVEGERSLVYQRHVNGGISDREVLLWMSHTTVDGYDRYGWTRAADQAFTAKDGNVAAARSDGYWQAKADPAGGVRVVHELRYDPAGSVPGFVVRAFQTGGLATNVKELHAALK